MRVSFLHCVAIRAPGFAALTRASVIALAALLLLAASIRAAEPVAPANRYAVVGGGKLYYEECGSGAAIDVVLLHDGLLHAVTWNEVWAPLCAKYHVLRYDRRGYGRSDAASAPFAPEDDLFQLMRQTKMERAIIVGNSSGAGLALDFALAHPDMVEGLFLIGPVVHGMASSAYFAERSARASAPMIKGDTKSTAENWARDPFLIAASHPQARRKFLDLLSQSPQNLIAGGSFETRPSPPTVLRLSQIGAPTLVVVGESDIADVIAYGGAIEAALPIVFFEVWKDAGHLIQLEQPAALVARFDRFSRLADRREASVAPATLTAYVGTYRYNNRTIVITLNGGRLMLGLPDYPDKPLFAASSSRFFVRTTETEFEFQSDDAGKIRQLKIHNADGATIDCPRA